MSKRGEIHDIKLPKSDEWVSKVKTKASDYMTRYGGCSQAMVAAFMEELGVDYPGLFHAAGTMQGGMLSSLTCGVHTAGMMVLGLLMGRESLEDGHDALYPVLEPAQELVKRLNKRLGSHSCKELTGVDFTDLAQAMEFMASDDYNKCITRVAEGTEEIALLLKELDEKGELFRIKMH
ncbi:MAG: C_GCAxxG_C_C family protein [Proteobacteria bacterium]|nr:C_GCAxxG_C_C family protein [Pseudomonadota bacterium]